MSQSSIKADIVYIIIMMAFLVIAYILAALNVVIEYWMVLVIGVIVVSIIAVWILTPPGVSKARTGFVRVERTQLTREQNVLINALIVAGITGLSALGGYGFPPTGEAIYSTLIAFGIAFLTFWAKERGVET